MERLRQGGVHPLTPARNRTGEDGLALIVAVLLLLLVSAMAVAAIDHAGGDLTLASRSRRTTTTLHAADAGLQLFASRVGRNPPVADPFTAALADGTNVRSGPRTDPAPQPIDVRTGVAPPEGYSINVGAGFVAETFESEVTAVGPTGSTVELEAKYWKLESAGGGY